MEAMTEIWGRIRNAAERFLRTWRSLLAFLPRFALRADHAAERLSLADLADDDATFIEDLTSPEAAPNSFVTTPGQRAITQYFEGQLESLEKRVDGRWNALNKAVDNLDASSAHRKIEALTDQFELTVEEHRQDEKLHRAEKRSEVARNQYAKFREQHHRQVPAEGSASKRGLIAVTALTALIGAALLRDLLAAHSYIGAMGWVLLLVVSTTLLPIWVADRVYRRTRHHDPSKRGEGWVGLLLWMFGTFVLGVSIAHASGADAGALVALQKFIADSSLFPLLQTIAWPVFWVLTGMAFICFVTELATDERYPGYGDVERAREKAETLLADARKVHRKAVLGEVRTTHDKIDKIVSRVQRAVKKAQQKRRAYDTALARASEGYEIANGACPELLSRYRERVVAVTPEAGDLLAEVPAFVEPLRGTAMTREDLQEIARELEDSAADAKRMLTRRAVADQPDPSVDDRRQPPSRNTRHQLVNVARLRDNA